MDFPSNWAPPLGDTWRITNDIIPEWPTVYRQINQFVLSAGYAGTGQWPDLDMLEGGNQIFTKSEEQRHFTLWAIAKSPLTIGCALNDTYTSIASSSLAILKNADVISYNQDSLGTAANLMRRYAEAGLDVWAGPLSGGGTVAALVKWNNHSITGVLNLPNARLQSAGWVKDVWNDKTVSNVVTSYMADIAAHGTLPLELANTLSAGTYRADRCSRIQDGGIIFDSVYGITESDKYSLTIQLSRNSNGHNPLSVSTSASSEPKTVRISSDVVHLPIVLKAISSNTITIRISARVSSIQVSSPEGEFYPSTDFSVAGSAYLYKCAPGLCLPASSKITNLTETGFASISVPQSMHVLGSSRYVEITYINNDVSLDISLTNGTNTRIITVAVNGAAPVRLDVPQSGHSSELFSPMNGWGDPATLGVLVDSFGSGNGKDKMIVSNANGNAGVQPYGADFVGLRVI